MRASLSPEVPSYIYCDINLYGHSHLSSLQDLVDLRPDCNHEWCESNGHAARTSQVRHQLGSSLPWQHVQVGIILSTALPLPPSI